MAQLDLEYIASLVDAAQGGDSNAFAELYLATYQKQYAFSYRYLNDEHQAHDSLQQTYISALKNLFSIDDSRIFIPWLSQINFRICFNKREATEDDPSPESRTVTIDSREYTVKQLMGLTPSESRAMVMKYYHNMDLREIASLMDCKVSAVKQYIKSGNQRLHDLLEH